VRQKEVSSRTIPQWGRVRGSLKAGSALPSGNLVTADLAVGQGEHVVPGELGKASELNYLMPRFGAVFAVAVARAAAAN
jgi:hypothetical protein